MNVLAVDTTSDRIVVALRTACGTDYYRGEAGCKKHNSALMKAIDDLLAKNGIGIGEIDYFGVCVGPGSFTGIRIGVSAVNALSMAVGKKIVEVVSLETEDDGREKAVLLPCGHGNFYAARFGKETAYYALSGEEAEKIEVPKIILEEIVPEKLLEKTMQKIYAEQFVEQAKPFYLKKSSAERIE